MDTLKLDEAAIFNRARQIEAPEARRRYIQEACGEDRALRERVEALLRVHEEERTFLQTPAEGEPATVQERSGESPGTQIGPYQLLEQIGEGGFGVVFLAEQQQPVRRKVALKVVKPGMDTRQVIARFEAERQALALMDHPHIARVLDGGETTSGRPYFVMELFRGVPLTRYCDEHRLTPRERLALFMPVCQAVQHAHQKGVIHRDLKPNNVLVAIAEGQPVPKVIDFGVAKALREQLTERTLVTGLGAIVGTLEYMSPEQSEFGASDVDTRADIYSLGVLLYELLTGTTPLTKQRLKDAALTDLLRSIREEEPPKPSVRLSEAKEGLASVAVRRGKEPARLIKEVRGDLDWVVMKCLDKDRTRRYETASGLARDIARYLHDEPVEASPPSAVYKLRKFARRNCVLLGVTAAFAALLAGAAVVSTWLAVRATLAEQTASRERDNAVAEKERADEKAAIAQAVNAFLQQDLLGQADIGNQPEAGARDRNITVRQLLDRAARRIKDKFQGQELTEAAIRLTLGDAYLALGEFREAQKHYDRSFRLRKQELGPGHADTLTGMSKLAGLYYARGRYAAAQRLYQEVLDARRARLGAAHPDTLQSMNDLGSLHCDRGNFDAAEKLLKQALELRKAGLGADHFDTLESMSNLASVYWSRGRYDKAEPLFQKVLEVERAKRGPDHPSTLRTMRNLATVYLLSKRYDKAEPLLKQVLAIQRVKLPAGHPDTLTTTDSLAALYRHSGRYDQAEALFKQVIQARRARLGAEHANTLSSLNNLAACYVEQGNFERAEPLLRQVTQVQRRTLGADHPNTTIGLNNLGTLYRERGRYSEAEPLLRAALAGARKRLGLNHPHTQAFLNNLSVLYCKQCKPHRAEALHRELAAFLRNKKGPDSLAYADQLVWLSRVLLDRKKYAEAEPVARESLAIHVKKKPDDYWAYFNRSLLGGALLGQKKYAQAEPLLLQGYEGMKQRERQVKEIGKRRQIQGLEWVVQLYEGWGKADKATQWRKKLAAEKATQKK
jgi:serine/threonine protein kinase/tetratricopeptide (TPR) repeat protein